MSGPVVYVSTWKVRSDKFDDYRRLHDRLVEVVRANEPRTAAFLLFANDDGSEITGIHVFADDSALEHHMGVLASQMSISAEDMGSVARLLEPGHIEYYGERSDQAAAMDRALAGTVPISGKARFVGGFVRS